MKIVIEDTSPDTDNKRKGISECDDDSLDVNRAMEMVTRALLSYGYQREQIADWLLDFAYQHQRLVEDYQKEESK